MAADPPCPDCDGSITHRAPDGRTPPACADCLFEDAIERSRHDPETVRAFLNQFDAPA